MIFDIPPAMTPRVTSLFHQVFSNLKIPQYPVEELWSANGCTVVVGRFSRFCRGGLAGVARALLAQPPAL